MVPLHFYPPPQKKYKRPDNKYLPCFPQFLLASVYYIDMYGTTKKVLCRTANWHHFPNTTFQQRVFLIVLQTNNKPLICSKAWFFSSSRCSLANSGALPQAKLLLIRQECQHKPIKFYYDIFWNAEILRNTESCKIMAMHGSVGKQNKIKKWLCHLLCLLTKQCKVFWSERVNDKSLLNTVSSYSLI